MYKRFGIICLAVSMAAMLTACGGGSADSAKYEATTESYDAVAYENTAGFAEPAAMEEAGYETGAETSNNTQVQETNRKLIKTVNMNVETEDFDGLLPDLETQITQMGGYIENISVDDRSYSYPEGAEYLRYASMTARIPKENLDAFLTHVGEQSNVVSRSENVEDVTLQYVDLESHKKALVTEQDRLLELMEQAETVEDIITIEGRLSEVRYQIESMESQLRTYDNKIDYSTVYLYINEVRRYSPSEEAGVGERIRSGFLKSLDGVGNGIVNFAVWFVVNLPYLFVWAVVIVILIVIIRLIIVKSEKKSLQRRKTFVSAPVYPNQNPYQYTASANGPYPSVREPGNTGIPGNAGMPESVKQPNEEQGKKETDDGK